MAREYGRMKTVFGLESDNFELYFQQQMTGLTGKQIEGVPKDIASTLFKTDHSLNVNKASKLTFLGKLWLLWRCRNNRIWIVVENDETGLDLDGFKKLQDSIKRRDYGVPKAEGLKTQGVFITSNRELSDTFDYLNKLSVSPAYNYLQKTKNFRKTDTSQSVEHMKYIVRIFQQYEGNKKKWVTDKQLSIPEFLVLIYLYDKEGPVNPAPMHKQVYLRSFHSTPRAIKKAYSDLNTRGLLLKTGANSGCKLEITPIGRSLISSILNNYALNC